MSTNWNRRFLNLADHVAEWSKDPSTKVGAVITMEKKVLSLGYNGFPAGTSDDDSLYNDRSQKYPRVIHAELNAIIGLPQHWSFSGHDLHMHSTLFPCSQCMGAAINAGIKWVHTYTPSTEQIERWGPSFDHSKKLAEEAGVRILLYPIF
jgi:dCMP deaminase